MNETTINKYYWVYLIGFFLILALPILNLPPWFSPVDWGKTIVFRIILSILIFLFVYQLTFQKGTEFLLKRNSVPFWLLLALFGVFLLATIFSQNPVYSFLGSPHRAGGFLNFGFYIIFAILAFLILRKQDWQKIWNFAIFIGILVSIIAIFQQYKILSNVFVPTGGRPFSFIGSSVLLALYLLLLVFITVSFLLEEKQVKKKLFYFLALLIFLYVILLTGSRAAYFGLLIGFVYFILCFPNKQRIVVLLKILFLTLLIAGVYGVYHVNTYPKLPNYLQENKILQQVSSRLSINLALQNPRFSAWVISLEAVKQRPILGYGPENFSIAFDKYYDPLLPYITKDWGSWYDKAHNFLFDISVTVGIPGLIIFISLFAVLFWRLQKIKYNPNNPNAIIAHGIQACFLAYFANNLFVFDTFSSYLVLFLLIAYSLSLISKETRSPLAIGERVSAKLKYKKTIILVLFVCLIWFIWSLNLKPLIINKQANIALELKDINCEQALAQMEPLIFSEKKVRGLDHYLGIKYANIINACIKKEPSKNIEMAQNVVRVLKRNTEIRPSYTRNWLYLGIYTNFLITKNLSSFDEADYYFTKANELSPKRQEIFNEWAKTYFITDNYSKAKEKAQKCIELNPFAIIGECWWIKGISNIYLGNIIEAKIDLQLAEEKRYDTESKISLLQLVEAYLKTENYEELIEIHEKLIKIEPDNAQYYTSLAYNYKVIGNYKKARETAEIILELFPEMKDKVEEFLKSLPKS